MATHTTCKSILCSAMILAATAARAWADLPITTLASFNGANGMNPVAGLTLLGNTLYGTTSSGGASDLGRLFAAPIAGGIRTNRISNH